MSMNHMSEATRQKDAPLLSCLLTVAKAFGEPDEARLRDAWHKTTGLADNKRLLAIVKTMQEGNFKPSVNLFGMDSGAIYLSDWHGHDADISADDMAKINAVISGIKDGSLKAQGILRKTSFE